ncbi:flavin-binding monooxygenase [Fusarium napiforme]|uniref:Flavin-binding monooxygenase n=1 Tax=Fusarium napiforme TaxID=42672 RepID=A0A8H5IHC0_9HYPO|nr:flavin-binding monooxygenase [Fusarium napiforme]
MAIENNAKQQPAPESIPTRPLDRFAMAETNTLKTQRTRLVFKIEEHPTDQVRDLKVAVIGAGLSGVTAAVLLTAKVPGLDLVVYEKNNNVGGTWLENTYPGVRCDFPSHVYQSGFSPSTEWSEEYAPGHEIRQYWEDVAKKHDVYKKIKFNQEIKHSEWISSENKWALTISDLKAATVREEKFDYVINAIGNFNAWKLPSYEGIEEFKGELFHSSNWNHSVDLKGKRIALIGNGASGLQILPQIQDSAAHIDHYARSRTWVTGSLNPDDIRQARVKVFPEELKEAWRKDPEEYLAYRRKVEAVYFQYFGAFFKDSPENNAQRKDWTNLMLERVKPELADKILPDFPPNCRRPTPGPGYLEAISQPNVSYIQTPIQRFTHKGIVTNDGVERDVDVVICATGANVDFAPPYPVISNGIDLQSAWKPGGLYGHPFLYLGIAAPDFPNLAFLGGAHAWSFSGTIPNTIENHTTYIAKILRKLRSQGLATITPSVPATEDFIAYCNEFFPRTVFTANDDSSANSKNCASWYNGGTKGGSLRGLFPASAAASNYIRRDPRWEDYEYTYHNASGNRFAWFGNGQLTREITKGSDVDWTPHLAVSGDVDLRVHCEGWWDV